MEGGNKVMTQKEELDHYRNEYFKYRDLYNARNDNGVVESINAKASQKLYKKVGKKFVQVNDPWAYDGLREGWWLIGVKAGSTSIRQCVHPDKAQVETAARDLEDKLVDIIRDACAAKPTTIKLTEEEKKDWDVFIAKHGDSFNTLHYPSFQQNAEKIVKAILNQK